MFIHKNIISSVATLYHEKGMPLSEIKKEAELKGLTINWHKTCEDLYFQGFNIDTILSLLKEEDIQVQEISKFLSLIIQPTRKNGGYELSRQLIFNIYFKTENGN